MGALHTERRKRELQALLEVQSLLSTTERESLRAILMERHAGGCGEREGDGR